MAENKEKTNVVEYGEFYIKEEMKNSPYLYRGALNPILETFKGIVADDATRPTLSCVNFDTKDGEGNIVATDGHIMAVVKIKGINKDFDGKSVLLGDSDSFQKEFNDWHDKEKFDDVFSFDEKLGRYNCVLNNKFLKNKYKYPNYDAVIPQLKNAKYTLTVDECIRAYKALKFQMGFLTKRWRELFKMIFRYGVGDESYYMFKGIYILKCLDVIIQAYQSERDRNVDFYFSSDDNNKCMIVICGGVTVLIMPMACYGAEAWSYIVDLNKLSYNLSNDVYENDNRAKFLVTTINSVIKETDERSKMNFSTSDFSFPEEKDSNGFMICYVPMINFLDKNYHGDMQCYVSEKEPFVRIFRTETNEDNYSTHEGDKEHFQKTCKNIYRIDINDFLRATEQNESESGKYLCLDFGKENAEEKKIYFWDKPFISVVEFFKKIGASYLLVGDCITQIGGDERTFISADVCSDDFIFVLPEIRRGNEKSVRFTYELKNKVVDENGRLATSNVDKKKNNANKKETIREKIKNLIQSNVFSNSIVIKEEKDGITFEDKSASEYDESDTRLTRRTTGMDVVYRAKNNNFVSLALGTIGDDEKIMELLRLDTPIIFDRYKSNSAFGGGSWYYYRIKFLCEDEDSVSENNEGGKKNNDDKKNDKKETETEIDIDMVRVKMIMVAKALKAKREREQMEREKKESNFSLGENGDVRINLAKKPKNWTYYDTPYGRLLKIPSKEYVTNDKEWSMSAFRQANEYDGYVFVFASLIPKKGYRPIDFDRDSEVADYIDNNIVKH